MFSRILTLGILAAAALSAQYKADSAGAPPSDLPPGFADVLQKQGTKILDAQGKAISEIWLVTTAPSGSKGGEENVTLTTIPHGALIGVMRFPAQFYDRRGQVVKPGVYSLRYSMFPISGDHQGIAPQRDFAILTRIADEKDTKALPNYDTLMDWSRKASGTPHPLCISIWKADDPKDDFYSSGETDWVVQRKMGDVELAIIVVGKTAA